MEVLKIFYNELYEIGIAIISIPEGVWQFLAVTIAAIAALFSYLSVRSTRLTSQGQLFSQMRFQYSSDDMRKALEIIGSLGKEEKKKEFEQILSQYSESKDKDIEGVECARRKVSHFFQNAFELYENNQALDKTSFHSICSLDGFEILYSVVEWLEVAKNQEFNRTKFTKMLLASGRSEQKIEELKKKRPPDTWSKVEDLINELQKRNLQMK